MNEVKELLIYLDTEKTTDEKMVCRAAFHGILRGEPVAPADLVAATGLPERTVNDLLAGLNQRGLIEVEPEGGLVVGSWGLSLVPSSHRLHIRNRELFTWCALDAVGIPAGLHEDAFISSSCQHCGSAVYIVLIGGAVAQSEPAEVRLWLTACQTGRSVVGFT